jgi:hypothetical protein
MTVTHCQQNLKCIQDCNHVKSLKCVYSRLHIIMKYYNVNSQFSTLTKEGNPMGIDILPRDILLGRGPTVYLHPGNVNFRDLVRSLATYYHNDAPTATKQLIAKEIFWLVYNNGGRFLHQAPLNSGKWIECSTTLAIKKIKHSLRDARFWHYEKERNKSSCIKDDMYEVHDLGHPFRIPDMTLLSPCSRNVEPNTCNDLEKISCHPKPRAELITKTEGVEEEEVAKCHVREWGSSNGSFSRESNRDVIEIFTESNEIGTISDFGHFSVPSTPSDESTATCDDLFDAIMEWLSEAN